jgi:hypothetical protein
MEERERQGVTLDVCGRCRGVFLDRGELEKLIALAEPAEVRSAPQRMADVDDSRSPRRDDDDDDDDDRDDRSRRTARVERDDDRHHDRRDDGRRKRRGGFLDVLGDIFD